MKESSCSGGFDATAVVINAQPFPEEFEQPSTIACYWASLVAQHGPRPFIRDGTHETTGHEIDALSSDIAAELLARGHGPGSRVGILMASGASWIACFIAVQRIGGVAVLLSTLMAPPELTHAIGHSQIATLLVSPTVMGRDMLSALEIALPGLTNARGSETLALEAAPRLTAIIADGAAPAWAAANLDAIERPASAASARELASLAASIDPYAPALMMYTSGSTAHPKAVIHSGAAVTDKLATLASARTLIPVGLEPGDRILVNAPFFWVGGFLFAFGAFAAGATVQLIEGRIPQAILDAIEDHALTHIDGSEPVLRDLAAIAPPGHRFHALRPLHASHRAFFTERAGRPRACALGSIGMTETLGPHSGNLETTELDHPTDAPLGRALPGMEYRIVDPESRAPLGAGEPGELLVRGRWLMLGLYGTTATATFDADGFYATGDLCSLDEQGFLRFRGRLSGMIKTSGANVSPEEVELALECHHDVIGAAVFGLPDPRRGEIVTAVIALRPGANRDPAVYAAGLKQRLSPFKVPRRLLVRDLADLPLTASRKIDRRALRERIIAELSTTEQPTQQGE